MKIRDVLRTKGPAVITIAPDVPVQEAMRVLVRNRIGALVVHDGKLRGIITERDILRCCADRPEKLTSTKIGDVPSRSSSHTPAKAKITMETANWMPMPAN